MTGKNALSSVGRVVPLVLLLMFMSGSALAQHLGARVQWQPETMVGDARLDQLVEIEIIGRAAVPVMQMLSEKTGVSLSVAPEDLNTVGERKLTIISKGLQLRVIMAQLPEALQEAHWDVDESGGEAVYLLHRNAGVEAEDQQRRQRRLAEYRERRKQANTQCIDDVRHALAMSPEELEGLEKTDLFLARAAGHPEFRVLLEAVLALPEPQMRELIEAGETKFAYTDAPPVIQRAARVIIALNRRMAEWVRPWWPEVNYTQGVGGHTIDEELARLEQTVEHLDRVTLAFSTNSAGGRTAQYGVSMSVGAFGAILVPARYPADWDFYYQFLLAETGKEDLARAREITDRLNTEWEHRMPELDETGWIEPVDPRLHERIELPVDQYGAVILSEAQQAIAERTGLSIVGDYFTNDRRALPLDQPPLGGPLWRDLYCLGQLGNKFHWHQAGDCIVFHHSSWYGLAQSEIPESVILDYRKRLQGQGHLVLDDVAELATVLESRAPGSFGGALPTDLSEAGAAPAADPILRRLLLVYRALTPEEKAVAMGTEGLRLSELSWKRRRQLREMLFPTSGDLGRVLSSARPIPTPTTLYVQQLASESGQSSTRFELRVETVGEGKVTPRVIVNLPDVPPEAE